MARPELPATTSAALTLDANSRALRRRLGPIAWTVLEDVVLDAQVIESRLVATTNVRRIAAHVGLTKDCVGRALARLTVNGLVTRQAQRRTSAGVFGATTYVVALTEGLSVAGVEHVAPRPLVRDTVTKPARRRRKALDAQLTLLDAPISQQQDREAPTTKPTNSTHQHNSTTEPHRVSGDSVSWSRVRDALDARVRQGVHTTVVEIGA